MKNNQWLKITGLFLISLFAADIVSAQTNDSIVNFEADVAQLSLLPANDVPSTGTFWLVSSNSGITAPFPCAPPGIENDNTYVLPNGTFLVDGTTGGSGVSGAQLVTQMNAVSNLIVRTSVVATPQARGMRTMDVSGPPSPGGGGDDGTNDYTPSDVTYTPPDYGTNFFISQWGIISNSLTGIASNTIADVTYLIQTNADLSTTNWGDTSLLVPGSETTNWTAFVVPPIASTPQLFYRLKSYQSSDGSGMPDWWEMEYFGTTGIDPYGNPAGDGYDNLYKFEHGLSPNSFCQPAAPQGLAVQVDGTGTNVTLSWQGVRGNVSGYTVYAVYPGGAAYPITVGTSLASQTTYSTTLSAPYIGTRNATPGYYVTAQYTNGISSYASAIAYVESEGQQVVQFIPDAAGHVELAVNGSLPLDASILLFDGSTRYSVAASNLVNGLYVMPDAFMATNSDLFGQILYTNGQVNWEYEFTPQTPTPFYDGRAQLKENLIFQLRSAAAAPLHFSIPSIGGDGGSFGAYVGDYNYSTNYAYAGLYQFANLSNNENFGLLDPFLPFEENCLFANFVVNLSDVDSSGNLVTGIASEFGHIDLNRPLTYQFQTNGMALPDLLATNISHWMYPDNEDPNWAFDSGLLSIDSDWNTYFTLSMTNGFRNWFGLPYDSTKLLWGNTSGNTATVNAGSSVTGWPDYSEAVEYLGTAEPKFQTVEYDFWNTTDPDLSLSLTYALVPGNPNFSPTNASQQMFVPVGSQSQIAGYAKLEVTNSAYTGVYGYLGQYFDHAYQIDTNGIVTTNTTGVLSPYGNFFATQPGPVALVTMPDIDTGERGTGIVYSVSLNVDKNHDGIMDLSFNGVDVTSQNSPFVFWCNNNFDRWTPDSDDGVDYMDGLDTIAVTKLSLENRAPDNNHTELNGTTRVIPCTRDLEDFARLWVCGITSNLLANLPTGSTVTLNWGDAGNPNNPTIDLFTAADPDGGMGYLTNETVAARQIDPAQSAYIGRLAPGHSLQLNSIFFSGWAGNHFIWCGVTNGSGALNLTIADGNGNVLAQTTTYIQIVDIKQMYERWTVGDNPSIAPRTSALLAQDNLPATMSTLFQYSPPTDTNTPYILFVHGWNMRSDDKDIFAETAFKRLYWHGYHGRFGLFKWPTDNGIASTADAVIQHRNFDNSEFNAWQSGQGLLNKLNSLNTEYPGNVYLMAHSMGNIVAGEALRLAGNNQVVNTYVAMQGAVPSHAYDPTTPVRSLLYQDNYTPNRYAEYYTNGAPCYFNGSAGAGTYVNFFNTNDFALDKWQIDQNFKPDNGWGYDTINDRFFRGTLLTTTLTFPADTYEIFAYCDEARCYALGAQPDVGGAFDDNQVNLPSIWPPDPAQNNYKEHFWHSAEFRSDIPQLWQFWDETMIKLRQKQP